MRALRSSLTADEAALLAPMQGQLWRHRETDLYCVQSVGPRQSGVGDEKNWTREIRVEFEVTGSTADSDLEVTAEAAKVLEAKFGPRIDR